MFSGHVTSYLGLPIRPKEQIEVIEYLKWKASSCPSILCHHFPL